LGIAADFIRSPTSAVSRSLLIGTSPPPRRSPGRTGPQRRERDTFRPCSRAHGCGRGREARAAVPRLRA
jgi:hypothetical protein